MIVRLVSHVNTTAVGGARVVESYPARIPASVRLYIATLFVVWQIVNAVVVTNYPTVPIAVGGSLIVAGGLILTFWNQGKAS